MNTRMAFLMAAVALGSAACSGGNDNGTDGGTIIPLDVPRPDTGSVVDTGNPTVDTGNVVDVGTPTDVGADAGAPNDTGTDAGVGGYVDGCYVGTPVTMTDFLNRCGGGVAFPARAARGARLLPDGGVQPLPM